MPVELLPCPLCGEKVKWNSGSIECKCGISFKTFFGAFDKTNRDWNQRANIKEQNFNSLQQLKAKIRSLVDKHDSFSSFRYDSDHVNALVSTRGYCRMEIKEPTGDECTAKAKVYETEHEIGYAMWYPQMGGYVGKCVVVLDKQWTDGGHYRLGGCFEAYVWHDGEFPFSEDDGVPARLHHCDPEQFIRFGEAVQRLNEQGCRAG